METFTGLCGLLGINRAVLLRLIREGLPWTAEGRAKRFDRATVDQWLLDRGYAEVEQPPAASGNGATEQIVRTYAELVEALGLQGKDPIRVVAGWSKLPGFPGRPGSPGRRDGWLPVEQIRRWATGLGGAAVEEFDEELGRLRIERERLKLEREIREEMLASGRLADVDEVARLIQRSVANAKAVLEPLPDLVLSILPESPPPADEWPRFLRSIHTGAQRLLDDVYQEIGAMEEVDEEGEDEE